MNIEYAGSSSSWHWLVFSGNCGGRKMWKGKIDQKEEELVALEEGRFSCFKSKPINVKLDWVS